MDCYRRAFTLIELLVVISIIAVLVGILLPALGAARKTATNVKCLSNIRQVALAMISYEADAQRLPMHLYEVAGSTLVPEQLSLIDTSGNPDYDVRDLYTQYMGSANFFSCPFQPEWDKSEAAIPVASKRIYADYQLLPGFFCNYDLVKYPQRYSNPHYMRGDESWIDTADRWIYEEHEVEVIAADRVTWEAGRYTRFNHPLKGGSFNVGADEADYNNDWISSQFWVQDPNDDVREYSDGNYAFKDGHAASYQGSNEAMLSITGPGPRLQERFWYPASD